MAKGNVTDVIFIAILAFSFVVTCVLCYTILDKFSTDTTGILNQTPLDNAKQALNIMDYVLAGFLVGAIIFSSISAYFIRSSPVFFVFGVIVLVVAVYASAIISNLGYDIFNTAALTTAAAQYPISMNVIQYLPFYVVVMGAIILIAMFGKGENPNYV